MKKIILLLILISGLAFGQSEIEGIGNFKIGMSIEDLNNYAKNEGISIEKCNTTGKCFSTFKKNILEINDYKPGLMSIRYTFKSYSNIEKNE